MPEICSYHHLLHRCDGCYSLCGTDTLLTWLRIMGTQPLLLSSPSHMLKYCTLCQWGQEKNIWRGIAVDTLCMTVTFHYRTHIITANITILRDRQNLYLLNVSAKWNNMHQVHKTAIYWLCNSSNFSEMIQHTFSWQTDGLMEGQTDGTKEVHKSPFQPFGGEATNNRNYPTVTS